MEAVTHSPVLELLNIDKSEMECSKICNSGEVMPVRIQFPPCYNNDSRNICGMGPFLQQAVLYDNRTIFKAGSFSPTEIVELVTELWKYTYYIRRCTTSVQPPIWRLFVRQVNFHISERTQGRQLITKLKPFIGGHIPHCYFVYGCSQRDYWRGSMKYLSSQQPAGNNMIAVLIWIMSAISSLDA